MNRRDFFKVLGATSLAATLPVAFDSIALSSNPLPHGWTMGRRSELFDYDQKQGLAVQVVTGNRPGDLNNGKLVQAYRHAILLRTDTWQEFTPEQKEETWLWLEKFTLDLAKRKEAGR